MTTGTPGFVGQRLREAREVRGLTAVTLSEIADVSRQSIYEYEAGRASPRAEVLARISSAVNLPQSFFLLPERPRPAETMFYRSMSSATKAARARAARRFGWLRDIVGYLTTYVALPDSNFPDLRLPDDPLLLSDAEIESAAEDVRRYWGMRDGPIANMVLLLENQGAVLARDQLGADTLDGLSQFVVQENRPYIMVGTDKGSAARWRFDAAHELGHIILHGRVAPELLSRAEHFKRIEEQAHRFAAALLLPLVPFSEDVFAANLDAFRSIKAKWKTSIAMMVMRARHADLISRDEEQRLWINMARRGWRRAEPLDDVLEVEEPRLLRRSFELVLEQSGQTSEDVLAALSLPAKDVEALSGLPPGFLTGFAPVTLLPRSTASGEPNRSTTPAEVIQLPVRRRTK